MANELHDAAMRGDVAAISEAKNVWLLNDKHENVMHTAARFGQSEVLAYLLQHHPSMGIQRNATGKTTLHYAVKKRQTHTVFQLMMLAPEWIDLVDNDGNTPLQRAINMEYCEAVLIMISQKPSCVHQLDSMQRTVLHNVVEHDTQTILQSLLLVCPVSFLIAQDEVGDTPLNLAVWHGEFESVQLLLKADPSALNIADNQGNTPALTAVKKSHDHILLFLVKTYPHVIDQTNFKNGANLLHYVTNIDTARELINLKPDLLDGVMNDGSTVLHIAMNSENEKYVKFLFKSKPSLLLHRDNHNMTPFTLATLFNNSQRINAILRFKPDLIDIDEDDNTVLHVAVEHDDSKIIDAVFAHCISNLYCENIYGKTPLCLAVKKNNRTAVQLFQSHITFEMAVAVRDACLKNCGIDLQALCLQHCDTLQQFILPSLTNIVFEYLGVTFSKKRKHQED